MTKTQTITVAVRYLGSNRLIIESEAEYVAFNDKEFIVLWQNQVLSTYSKDKYWYEVIK